MKNTILRTFNKPERFWVFFWLWQKSCSRGEVRGVLKILVKLGILRISGQICPQFCCYLLKWSSTYVLEISCFEQFQKILDKILLKDCFSFCFEKEIFLFEVLMSSSNKNSSSLTMLSEKAFSNRNRVSGKESMFVCFSAKILMAP